MSAARIISCDKIVTGSLASIGGTALQLTTNATPLKRGVKIKAASANGANFLYVGLVGVTAGVAAPTTDGYQLAANAEVDIEIDDASRIYVIASASSQACTFLAR